MRVLVLIITLSITLQQLVMAQPIFKRQFLIRKGELPILLSAPHGGKLQLPGVEPRKGVGRNQFVTVRDDDTDILVTKIATHLEKQLGRKPYLVVAKFDRQYVDLNRRPEDAYEMEAAKPYYDFYHQALADARAEILSKWDLGLLIDIHGQAAKPETIFRGTAKGATVEALIRKLGDAALRGNNSLLGILEAKGYHLFPANDSTEPEDSRFGGGYTVQRHGSKQNPMFAAIQLEFGAALRHKQRINKTAEDMATAIAGFLKAYYKEFAE